MNHKNDCCCDLDTMRAKLCDNTGRIVTIITESGGCSGEGFTGIVASMCDDTLKLITSLPSPPPYPFQGGCCRRGCNHFHTQRCCPMYMGSAIYIPICKIVAVVTAEM